MLKLYDKTFRKTVFGKKSPKLKFTSTGGHRSVIAFFMFSGTGGSNSPEVCNGMLVMTGKKDTKPVYKYYDCQTPEARVAYVKNHLGVFDIEHRKLTTKGTCEKMMKKLYNTVGKKYAWNYGKKVSGWNNWLMKRGALVIRQRREGKTPQPAPSYAKPGCTPKYDM